MNLIHGFFICMKYEPILCVGFLNFFMIIQRATFVKSLGENFDRDRYTLYMFLIITQFDKHWR